MRSLVLWTIPPITNSDPIMPRSVRNRAGAVEGWHLAWERVAVVRLARATVLLALLLTACSGDDQASRSGGLLPPAEVSLPPISASSKAATVAYLAGPGKLYVNFRTASRELLELTPANPVHPETVRKCEVLSRSVTAAAESGQLLAVARQIPDETMAILAVDERAARGYLLRACVSGDIPDRLVQSAANVNTLVNRRLKELQ